MAQRIKHTPVRIKRIAHKSGRYGNYLGVTAEFADGKVWFAVNDVNMAQTLRVAALVHLTFTAEDAKENITFLKGVKITEIEYPDGDRKVLAPAPEPKPETQTQVAETADMNEILALFERGGRKLKFPKVHLQTADGRKVVLARAGARSRYNGQIKVTDGQGYGNGRFYGWVRLDGSTTVTDAQVLDLLVELAGDPLATAVKYGKLTGHCCFCFLALGGGEDKRSVEIGYGPVCAKHYGLPWGTKAAEGEALQKLAEELMVVPEEKPVCCEVLGEPTVKDAHGDAFEAARGVGTL